MIDVTETLRWALVIFAISLGSKGEEIVTHSAPSYHQSYAACVAEGERLLAVIDVEPGVQIRSACVPRDVEFQ